MVPRPHFLLFCDGQSPKVAAQATATGAQVASSVRGRWRFVLEDLEAGTRLEACDAEIVQAPERTALLAVVRGLEAIEQPSRVTLVTTSRYVSRGLQFGLMEWRESDYCWEHFGSVQPIRNADLWRRIDHALQYHQINCQWIAGQSSEGGEEITKFQAEPIASALAVTLAENIERSTVATQGEKQKTLTTFDGREIAVEGGQTHGESSWWRRIAWRMLGAPVRSLRLPNVSSLLTSSIWHGWFKKMRSRPWWMIKRDRARRLAL